MRERSSERLRKGDVREAGAERSAEGGVQGVRAPGALVLVPDDLELLARVVRDRLLNGTDVGAVEVRKFLCGRGVASVTSFVTRSEVGGRTGARRRAHELSKLLVVERHAGKNLETGRGHTALVGRRVAVDDDALLLELKTRALADEKVRAYGWSVVRSECEGTRRPRRKRTLDDVLEVGHTLGVPELRDVVDVDGLGTATAGHEDVGLVAEVGRVAEVGAIRDNIAVCMSSEISRSILTLAYGPLHQTYWEG